MQGRDGTRRKMNEVERTSMYIFKFSLPQPIFFRFMLRAGCMQRSTLVEFQQLLRDLELRVT